MGKEGMGGCNGRNSEQLYCELKCSFVAKLRFMGLL